MIKIVQQCETSSAKGLLLRLWWAASGGWREGVWCDGIGDEHEGLWTQQRHSGAKSLQTFFFFLMKVQREKEQKWNGCWKRLLSWRIRWRRPRSSIFKNTKWERRLGESCSKAEEFIPDGLSDTVLEHSLCNGSRRKNGASVVQLRSAPPLPVYSDWSGGMRKTWLYLWQQWHQEYRFFSPPWTKWFLSRLRCG